MLTGSPATSHSLVRFSISIYTNIYRYTLRVMEVVTLPYFDQLLLRLPSINEIREISKI